jgi:branched-chain amino acid transport system substrate-binding protein
MKKAIIGLASIAALLAAPAAAQKLKIGYITTLSGGGAVLGKHQRDGFALGVEMLGGKVGGLDTEVIYGDDQRKPDVGRQVADKMVKKDKVQFIAGPIWSNILLAIQRPVTRAKVFLISTNAGASPMAGRLCNPYYFTTSWNNDNMPEATGQLVNDDGVKNTFLMAANYQAGKDMIAGFKRTYKGKIAGQIMTKLGAKDYQAEISQLRSRKPEALYVFLPGGMGIAFMKQWGASGAGKNIRLYTVFTVDWATLPASGVNAVGSFHANYWSPDLDNAANKKFVAAFKKKYGYMPSNFAAQAYDAPFLIDSAVRAVGGNLKDHDGLRAAMRKADYASTRGKYTYNVNHHPIQNYYKREVVRGADGKATIVNRGIVLKNHKDAYYKQCKMKW